MNTRTCLPLMPPSDVFCLLFPSLPACTHAETHLLTHPCLWRHDLKFLCSSAPKHRPETSSALKELFLTSFFPTNTDLIFGKQKLRTRWVKFPKSEEVFQDMGRSVWFLHTGISQPSIYAWGSYLAPSCHTKRAQVFFCRTCVVAASPTWVSWVPPGINSRTGCLDGPHSAGWDSAQYPVEGYSIDLS